MAAVEAEVAGVQPGGAEGVFGTVAAADGAARSGDGAVAPGAEGDRHAARGGAEAAGAGDPAAALGGGGLGSASSSVRSVDFGGFRTFGATGVYARVSKRPSDAISANWRGATGRSRESSLTGWVPARDFFCFSGLRRAGWGWDRPGRRVGPRHGAFFRPGGGRLAIWPPPTSATRPPSPM